MESAPRIQNTTRPLIPAASGRGIRGRTLINKQFYYESKIREILVEAGFSEVMTSSFFATGYAAILKPLAEDKKFARAELRGGFAAALKMNALNAPLFGADETKIFEIGTVFPKAGEHSALALGYAGSRKKVAPELSAAVKILGAKLGAVLNGETKDGIFECNLDSAFKKLPEPKNWDIKIPLIKTFAFKPFSLYPFIVRDIAFFVPVEIGEQEALGKLTALLTENQDLIVKGPTLFDMFEKDGKKSFAFRIVLQSFDRTLTDDEVNKIMDAVSSSLSKHGWQVR